VLITGAGTGTGKEVVARAHLPAQFPVQGAVPRPQLRRDSGAAPGEASLFGHEKGAFTGGGTGAASASSSSATAAPCSLDEIGDMPLGAPGQDAAASPGAVLRAPSAAGGDHPPPTSDSSPPPTATLKGLVPPRGKVPGGPCIIGWGVFTIQLPRFCAERGGPTLPLLVRHFVRPLQQGKLGREVRRGSPPIALRRLCAYPWAGQRPRAAEASSSRPCCGPEGPVPAPSVPAGTPWNGRGESRADRPGLRREFHSEGVRHSPPGCFRPSATCMRTFTASWTGCWLAPRPWSTPGGSKHQAAIPWLGIARPDPCALKVRDLGAWDDPQRIKAQPCSSPTSPVSVTFVSISRYRGGPINLDRSAIG